MGIELGTAVTLAALLGTGAAVGTSMYSAAANAEEGKKSREAAERAAANQNLGNLSDEQMAMSASKKAFRQGLYFTSPTGTLGSGTRGRSRLMGA